MKIEGTIFGSIAIDGKTYKHDVIIRLSGEVVKRKKKLSKMYCGTSHILSKDEAKLVLERGREQLILGSGQMGNVASCTALNQDGQRGQVWAPTIEGCSYPAPRHRSKWSTPKLESGYLASGR